MRAPRDGRPDDARRCPGWPERESPPTSLTESRATCGMPGPQRAANDAAAGQSKQYRTGGEFDRCPALGTTIERRHHTQLAQTGQLEPHDPPSPQVSVAQMPQSDPRRVEQPWVRVVDVGQIDQQFGDVIAGIQGRKIAAKRCESLDRHCLGQQVERFGRLGKKHNIGNAQQVKSTLDRRLEASCTLGQHRDLPQLTREQGRHQAGLENLNRTQHQRESSLRGHFLSHPSRGLCHPQSGRPAGTPRDRSPGTHPNFCSLAPHSASPSMITLHAHRSHGKGERKQCHQTVSQFIH